jgi:Ca-activated chloride channel family protein
LVRSVVCCLLLCGFALPVVAAARVEVVLDASQEMWAAIEAGRPRFVAARMALATWLLERSGDPTLELGLRLAGGGAPDDAHDPCEDAARLIAPGAPDTAAWRAAVDAVRPAGARPLLRAVTAAAADLGEGKEQRRIVLVTAGEETCFGDEQAAVAALASGVELRVVGVGLGDDAVAHFGAVAPTRNATSTATLLTALRWSVEDLAGVEAVDSSVQIRLAGAPGATAASLVHTVAGERRELAASGEFFVGAAPAGLYTLELAGADVEPLRLDEIAVPAGRGLELDLELPPPPLADLEVIPEQPVAGSLFVIGVGGLGDGLHRLSVAPAGAPPAAWIDAGSAVGPGGIVELRAPDEPGPLEVRLHETLGGGTSRLVARGELESAAPEVTLSVPEEVRPFEPLAAAWTGPDSPGDRVSLVLPGLPSAAASACALTRRGSPASLTAPGEEGPWEVRYVSGLSGRTLARATVEVTAVIVTLDAPAEVAAGHRFEVGWEGPARAADYLALAAAGGPDEGYISLHLASQGSPARFDAPWQPGSYEVRYVEGDRHRVRRRTTVAVVPTPVTLKAPRRIRAGTRFEVRWTGPDRPGDYLAVAARGAAPQAHEDWCFTSGGSPASLAAPFEAGDYELRYVSGTGQEVLAALPLTVVE